LSDVVFMLRSGFLEVQIGEEQLSDSGNSTSNKNSDNKNT
jgi:hypothetical protein